MPASVLSYSIELQPRPFYGKDFIEPKTHINLTSRSTFSIVESAGLLYLLWISTGYAYNTYIHTYAPHNLPFPLPTPNNKCETIPLISSVLARCMSQLLELMRDTPKTSRLRNNILQILRIMSISRHHFKVNQANAASSLNEQCFAPRRAQKEGAVEKTNRLPLYP